MKELKHKIIRACLLKDKGFSLLEVLVGILILTGFTLAAMQSFALAVRFRVQAEEKARATNWIDEQLEEIRFVGSLCTDTLETSSSSDNDCDDNENCGQALENHQDFPGVPNSRDLVGARTVNLTRTTTQDGNVLEISYTAEEDDDGDTITQINTEVIPDAAYGQCD